MRDLQRTKEGSGVVLEPVHGSVEVVTEHSGVGECP